MDTKLLGGILLIVGTSIGGAMLALPIATAPAGFLHSTLLLLLCWFIMTASGLLVLEVNLWLPADSNIISMAKATLGRAGQGIAWLTYLLLFYSLLAAYMAGGGDFLHNFLGIIGVHWPDWVTILIFSTVLGYIVYCGIRVVDYVNRGLMFTKLGAYILLVICLLPFVNAAKLIGGEFKYITGSMTVAITSFGFATIIPSLRTYFKDDVVKLRRAILIGSLIPLTCYIAWDLAIMGVIPRASLVAMLHADNATSAFVDTLSSLVKENTVTYFSRIFTSVCLATSFLGVALGLSDFLADGLNKVKHGKDNLIIFGATFLPPLVIVLFDPRIFIAALSYAGIYCSVLLALLPALMAWSGRYYKKISQNSYQVRGGKFLLVFILLAAIMMIVQGIIETML